MNIEEILQAFTKEGFSLTNHQAVRASIIKANTDLMKIDKNRIKVYTLIYKYEAINGNYQIYAVTVDGELVGFAYRDSYTGNKSLELKYIKSFADLKMYYQTAKDIIIMNETDFY